MDPVPFFVKVIDRVAHLTAAANARYGCQMAVPKVMFTQRGQIAGRASYAAHAVNFNKVLMVENWADFDQTIIHEVAHLVTRAVHGRAVEPHGHQWRNVMVALGGEPRRCHSYDVESVKIERTKYRYECPQCGKTFDVGPKIHKKISVLGRTYRCRCSGAVKFVSVKARTATSEIKADMPAADDLLARFGTKKRAAMHLIKMNPTADRAAIINMFMVKLDMSPAGAASYYHAWKKGA
jgi:SprT protein